MRWMNVHTLYLQKGALKGPHCEDLAMIRLKEDDRDKYLRARFDRWRAEPGADNMKAKKKILQSLEFVRIVPKETGPLEERYKSVVDRKTGTSDDIILED
jgi:hypothetical protein